MRMFSPRYYIGPEKEKPNPPEKFFLFGVNDEGVVRHATVAMDYQLATKVVFCSIRDRFLGNEVIELNWYFTDNPTQYMKWLHIANKEDRHDDIRVDEFGGLGKVKEISVGFKNKNRKKNKKIF